ncbi:MAG: hypothetical protein ABIQ35_09815 [Verrucomicrobiota bacterium]
MKQTFSTQGSIANPLISVFPSHTSVIDILSPAASAFVFSATVGSHASLNV